MRRRFAVPETLEWVELAQRNFQFPYVVGIVLSIGVALFARLVRLDRDRAFYPTVTIVIASYYVLFAVMTGSIQTVVLESAVMTLFVIAAVAGFKGSAWTIVGAVAGHGVQRLSQPHRRER